MSSLQGGVQGVIYCRGFLKGSRRGILGVETMAHMSCSLNSLNGVI